MAAAVDESSPQSFDPESYRMTLGDHLEELRRRLIYALVGFFVAGVLCLFFGKDMVANFCAPLTDTLRQYDINPQLYMSNVGDGFSVYIQISMICAGVLASPWIVWQLWQFVAAGLYPNERNTVTRYVPLSLALLIVGDVFVYYVILPWTLQFFMAFSLSIPMQKESVQLAPTTQIANLMHVPSLAGTPGTLTPGMLWLDTTQQRLKFVVGDAADLHVRVLPFGPENLVAPQIQLPDYIDLVLSMLVVFGLSFQMPLVVLALVKVGVLEVEVLRRVRKMVYFVLAIVSAVITPGDAITSTVGMMIPLILLFEMGLWLGARAVKADKARLDA